MNTIYLLDALFLFIAGLAAIFAFGLAQSRVSNASRVIFFICAALFLVSLILSYLPQGAGIEPAGKPGGTP